MENTESKSNLTEGTWEVVKNHPVLGNPALMSGNKCIVEFFDWRGDTFDRLTPEESKANEKVICEAKNNFLLLKEIESIYVNKAKVNMLTVFEIGILSKVEQAIKNSI